MSRILCVPCCTGKISDLDRRYYQNTGIIWYRACQKSCIFFAPPQKLRFWSKLHSGLLNIQLILNCLSNQISSICDEQGPESRTGATASVCVGKLQHAFQSSGSAYVSYAGIYWSGAKTADVNFDMTLDNKSVPNWVIHIIAFKNLRKQNESS